MAILYRDGLAGKVCSRCDEWKPVEEFTRRLLRGDGYQAECKACKAARDRKRYAENPERAREKNQRYWAAHKERLREQNRRWKAANPERVREQQRAYRAGHREWDRSRSRKWARANPNKKREMNRAFARANPDLRRVWKRKWREANADKNRAQYHRRRTREIDNGGSFTAAEWVALKESYDYTCLCCGRQEPEIQLTPDHVIPVEKGGSGAIRNIQPLCGLCNSSKGVKCIDYRLEA
jgi:hypothetical protein